MRRHPRHIFRVKRVPHSIFISLPQDRRASGLLVDILAPESGTVELSDLVGRLMEK
jgi:hypothetical protein